MSIQAYEDACFLEVPPQHTTSRSHKYHLNLCSARHAILWLCLSCLRMTTAECTMPIPNAPHSDYLVKAVKGQQRLF